MMERMWTWKKEKYAQAKTHASETWTGMTSIAHTKQVMSQEDSKATKRSISKMACWVGVLAFAMCSLYLSRFQAVMNAQSLYLE